jgi:predicted ATPase
MTLELKNIGMIKEANVKINGLTVIAGENDTGKSTVSKALYLICQHTKYNDNNNKILMNNKGVFSRYSYIRRKIFKESFYADYKIELDYKENYIKYKETYYENEKNPNLIDILFIETPLVWNFTDFFRDIAQIESQMRIELDYPYLMKDLNFKLHIKSASNGLDIKEKVTSLMGGEFKKDEMGRYYFDKKGQRIELVNTATGIKYFGIFQVLSQNNYLNENTVLVLDEPEVHLHPKWQLEMAKIIVELVKNGVKIVVNSHSPYMIEALKRYSEVEEIEDKTNFYLAEDGYIEYQESLEDIFEKLVLPIRELKKLKMDRYLND